MKQAREKTDKTIAAADQALKSAEKKAFQTMKGMIKLSGDTNCDLETKAVKAVTALRKPYWFEKFHWFVSTDNYIVVGGRDVTQNDVWLWLQTTTNLDRCYTEDISRRAISTSTVMSSAPPVASLRILLASLCHPTRSPKPLRLHFAIALPGRISTLFCSSLISFLLGLCILSLRLF